LPRLPERRKPMTIAAVFNCADGIVLGADTKYVTGVSQFYQTKIHDVSTNDCQLLVALAGNVDYGKMVVDILQVNIAKCKNYEEMRVLVEAATLKVYKERIASVFQPNDRTRPQIEAIIVASFSKAEPQGDPIAWKVVDASINRVRGF
jgi:20S proteasome alpha/beta subunit